MPGETKESIKTSIQENGIEHVFIEFPDISGLSRSKQLASEYFLEKFDDGFSMNLALLTQTVRGEVIDESAYSDAITFADGTIYPDPETFRPVPWRGDAARVICDFEFRNEPVEGAPRTALKRVLERASKDGISFSIGSELEFFLLNETEDGYAPATDDKYECLTMATESVSPFYDRIYERAANFDLDVNTLHHEFGAGQLEILFDYDTPLDAADQAFRFKELVKQTARDCGQHATFMAKPFTEFAGSGYHVHVGAFEDGENCFDGSDDSLSETGRHFVGGLIEHADAIAALGTPNLNGFKRYQPGSFAPYSVSWGYDNRYAAVRIPPHGTTRIENRLASADANPYILIAATIAAGLDGIREKREPPEPSPDDPAGSRPRLPSTPGAALSALEADDSLTELLGAELVSEYVAQKRYELEKFYDETTQWERTEYIETL